MAHAAWMENRGGELFFVEASRTASGWVFSERSTYEVRWFIVQPRDGWIDEAKRLMSQATENPAGGDDPAGEPLQGAAAPQVGVGDFHDNASVLALANWKINKGAVEEGLTMLNVLRAHIVRADDQKSRSILIPVIEKAIEWVYREQAEERRAAASTIGQRPGAVSSVPFFSATAQMSGHPQSDIVSRFKLHMIDVVAIVTALAWTHSMLVHEITTLPGLATNPTGANVIAGSVLAMVLRIVSRTGRV